MERALAAANPAVLPLLPARELGAELWLRTYRYDDARRDARALLDAQPRRISPFVVLAAPATASRTRAPPPTRGGACSSSAPPPTPTTRIRIEAQRALAARVVARVRTQVAGKPAVLLIPTTCAVCRALCRAMK